MLLPILDVKRDLKRRGLARRDESALRLLDHVLITPPVRPSPPRDNRSEKSAQDALGADAHGLANEENYGPRNEV